MDKRAALIEKGVKLPNPESVEIGNDIEVDKISGDGVTVHTGCKLYGKDTFIAAGARIGFEGPVTIKNSYIGPSVSLNGGSFEHSVFLEKSSCGLGSHVRKGTILEEKASIAHTVGLKQTILFPFVTLGSLINFCDCLMAGGSSRKNHSEVGSSYIHFNYTPNQDKATPSLMGDVANGVMMNKPPIFLGGQGGLVGPCRIAYGTIIAAGSICRKDQMTENHLVIEGSPGNVRMPFKTGGYRSLKRIFNNNFYYISNLFALGQWYQCIRRRFIGPQYPEPLAEGLKITLGHGISERIKQMARLKDKISATLDPASKATIGWRFCEQWDKIQEIVTDLETYEGSAKLKDDFLEIIEGKIREYGRDYLQAIRALSSDQSETGTLWLQSIVDHVNSQISQILDA